MRDLGTLALSLALPWIAGALGVAALWRGRGERIGLLPIGYGYPVGALATMLLLRVASLAGLHWSFVAIAGALIALGAVGWYAARPLSTLRSGFSRGGGTLAALPPMARRAFWLFALLAAANVVALVGCVAWGLIEPYDALAHWADKTRVWYEYGRMMPFVDAAHWRQLGDVQHFWDPNPGHPGAVPLLEVWTLLAIGHWDESLMNLPWAGVFAALGIAFYAQVRRLGAGPAKAIACAYLLLSVPFLQINVAVAGMADIFLAAAYGLAAISLWQWTLTRQWPDAALAVLMAILCAMVKNEGIVWALTLVPAVLVALHRRVGFALCAAAALGGIAFLAFGPGEFRVLGYRVSNTLVSVWTPTLEHMFVMDNWHLLWYAAVAIVAWNARRLLSERLAPMTVTITAAAGFVFVVYGLSNAAIGVAGENLVNRFLLHTVPALAFYLVAILDEHAKRSTAAAGAAPVAASAA